MNRVLPGDPTMSWLMQKLDGTQTAFDAQCTGGFCGSTMPLTQPQLSPGVRDSIRAWITNGAANDCLPLIRSRFREARWHDRSSSG